MSKTMNNPVENELNAIRIGLYEETKNMTASERVAYMRKKTEDGLRASGYKLVPKGDKGGMRLVRI
jgi:hypothetical protein